MEQAKENLHWNRFGESTKKVISKISDIIHGHRKRIITKGTAGLVQSKNENTCDPCALASTFCQCFLDSWTMVSCEIPVKKEEKFLSASDCCPKTGMLLKPQNFYLFFFLYIAYIHIHLHTHTKNLMKGSKPEILYISSHWKANLIFFNYQLLK